MQKKLKVVIVPVGKEGLNDGDITRQKETGSKHSLYWEGCYLLFIDESVGITHGDIVYCSTEQSIRQGQPSVFVYNNKIIYSTYYGNAGRFFKVIASCPNISGTLPISITDAREWCKNPSEDVEIEMETILDYVGSNSDGRNQYIISGEKPLLNEQGCVIMVKEEKEHKKYSSLYENKEAIENYIGALKEYWDEENQCWLKSKNTQDNITIKKVKDITEFNPLAECDTIKTFPLEIESKEMRLAINKHLSLLPKISTTPVSEQDLINSEFSFIEGYTAAQQQNESVMALLKEMCDYLDDKHPQGSQDARAINTISTGSIFHQQIYALWQTNKKQ